MCEVKVKCCPCCGSTRIYFTKSLFDGYGNCLTHYIIRCRDCGISSDRMTISGAVDAWNKRESPIYLGDIVIQID